MKRMHVGVKVKALKPSVEFYSRLFGRPPTFEKPDYAKWMLDDPCLNFSLIERAGEPGLHHLGFQLESESALEEAREDLSQKGFETVDEDHLACGYQVQSKSWVIDPQGVGIEHFFTYGVVDSYGESSEQDPRIKTLRDKALAASGDGADADG